MSLEFEDPFAGDVIPDAPGEPPFCDRLAALIWEEGRDPGHNEEMGDGRMIGYIVIAEYAGVDGSRWLRRMSGDGLGGPVPTWQIQGYIQSTLDDVAKHNIFSDFTQEGDDES